MKENEGAGAEIEDVWVSLLRPVLKHSCYLHEADKGIQERGGGNFDDLIVPKRKSLNTFRAVPRVERTRICLSRKFVRGEQ